MPGDNANKAKQKSLRENRRHQMRTEVAGMSRYETECEGYLPPEYRYDLLTVNIYTLHKTIKKN